MARKIVRLVCSNVLVIVCSLICLSQFAMAQNSNSSPDSGLEASIHQLAKEIAAQMTQRNIKKIAIDDFTDLNGRQSALGDFISEELVTNFYTAGAGSFDVVERRELARVMQEQKLQNTGLLDKTSIATIGKLLGVEAIVTGSIAYWGKAIKINARMIGVENAKVFAAAAKKVPMDPMIEDLLNQSARATGFGSNASGVQIQRFDAFFQNKFLRVEPKAIHKSKDKKKVVVTLVFKNISKETLMIAMDVLSNDHPKATLDCHNGEVLRAPSNTGIAVMQFGHERIERSSILDTGDVGSTILAFESDDEVGSDTFSLSIEMFRLTDKNSKSKRFTVGIPNLKL